MYRFADETVMDLMQRIELEPDPELQITGSRIFIKNKDGSVIEDQLLPDKNTFNFNRDEAIAAISDLQPEMKISQHRFFFVSIIFQKDFACIYRIVK